MIFLHPSKTTLASKIGAYRQAIPAPIAAAFDPRAAGLPGTENQEETEECECYAYPFAFWAAVGFKGEEASHRALYWMSLIRGRHFATEPLPDVGTTDADVLGAITLAGDSANDAAVYGLVPRSLWPDDFARTNQELPFDVLQAAVPIQPGDVALITSTGTQLIADIQSAVYGGDRLKWAVPFTTSVDDSYQALEAGEVWRGRKGPSRGLHKTAIVGYAPDPEAADGLPKLLVRGSWGPAYGDRGYIWIAGAAVASPDTCSDFVVVKGGPVL